MVTLPKYKCTGNCLLLTLKYICPKVESLLNDEVTTSDAFEQIFIMTNTINNNKQECGSAHCTWKRTQYFSDC